MRPLNAEGPVSSIMERALRFVAACAFFTSLPIYSPNIMALNTTSVESLIGPFVQPLMIATFVVSLLLMCACIRGAVTSLSRQARLFGIAVYALGCTGYAAVLALMPGGGPVIAVACALLAAAGLVPTCCAWTALFEDLDLRAMIRLLAGVSVCSVLCNLVLGSISSSARYVVYAAFVLIGIAFPVVELALGERGAGNLGQLRGSGRPTQGRCAPEGDALNPLKIGPFLSVVASPLIGMLISSFATGVQPIYLGGGALSAHHVGMVGAAAVAGALWTCRSRKPYYAFIYQAALPVVACLAIVVCVLPETVGSHDMRLAFVIVFYTLVSILALASAMAISNAREFPRVFVFAVVIGAFSGMSELGLVFGSVLKLDDFTYYNVLTVLTAAYCAWMLMHGSLRSWKQTVSVDEAYREPQGVARVSTREESLQQKNDSETEESFDQRIVRIAEAAGLSPREKEIMGYIGRGYSSVYVAKNLLISESTVYTHVRNIYRKLEIASREDLIRLLNEKTVG